MLDIEEDLTPDQIRARIAEAKRKKDEAALKRDPKTRRAAESKQRKGRVNPTLLRDQPAGPGRDEPWTFRARPDLIKQVKSLATELSEPRAKVSVAALMEEAMELLLAHYRNKENGSA